MENKVTLYIATHRTGLKYFGKTERYFTQEDLQKYYHGSGIGWKKHLKKHGDDVTMEIYGIYKKSEVKEVALNFSRNNNIVESELWANRKEEDGFTGGKHSEETKEKLSLVKIGELNPLYGKKPWNYNLEMSDDFKKKVSYSKKGCIAWNKGMNDLSNGFRHSEYSKKLMSEKTKGKPKSESHKNKLSILNKGKKLSEETRMKQSESMKKYTRPKGKCIYCNIEMDINSLNRYHNDNCKNKGFI